MAVTRGTYTQGHRKTATGTPTGHVTGREMFQDVDLSPATLKAGTLQQRFDLAAYPQKGVTFTGTDSMGRVHPAPAKAG